MKQIQSQSGLAAINNARIYYEIAGEGEPFVMIHAGVTDSRQWNNEFAHFSQNYRVLRYDLRGYGKSRPVEGEFTHMGDLVALLDHLEIRQPLILMGCSMGGGIAMDFTLEHLDRVKALTMVDSNPSDWELQVPTPPNFEEAEQAYQAGELDPLAEIETQIWFDGMGRTPDQVNPEMRKLVYEMDRLALSHEAKGMGKCLPDTEIPAMERLNQLKIPILVIVGNHDVPSILAAADFMVEKISSAHKVVIEDAAHLPNMEHPDEFQRVLSEFLDSLSI